MHRREELRIEEDKLNRSLDTMMEKLAEKLDRPRIWQAGRESFRTSVSRSQRNFSPITSGSLRRSDRDSDTQDLISATRRMLRDEGRCLQDAEEQLEVLAMDAEDLDIARSNVEESIRSLHDRVSAIHRINSTWTDTTRRRTTTTTPVKY